MILYHAADLLWASKIKGTADALGIPCRPVRNAEMLAARLADAPTEQSPRGVVAFLADLDPPATETSLALIQQLREAMARLPNSSASSGSAGSVQIVAFGPHVDTEALRAAKSAGADTVMTRGAFNAKLPELLKQLHAGSLQH